MCVEECGRVRLCVLCYPAAVVIGGAVAGLRGTLGEEVRVVCVARSKKQEARSKKQEAISKKQEARSKMQEARRSKKQEERRSKKYEVL